MVVCKKHKKYKAIRAPKVDCKGCWIVFRIKVQNDIIDNLIKDGLKHNLLIKSE